jgi:hypothetical protein
MVTEQIPHPTLSSVGTDISIAAKMPNLETPSMSRMPHS